MIQQILFISSALERMSSFLQRAALSSRHMESTNQVSFRSAFQPKQILINEDHAKHINNGIYYIQVKLLLILLNKNNNSNAS